jgi:hypothetical protein
VAATFLETLHDLEERIIFLGGADTYAQAALQAWT